MFSMATVMDRAYRDYEDFNSAEWTYPQAAMILFGIEVAKIEAICNGPVVSGYSQMHVLITYVGGAYISAKLFNLTDSTIGNMYRDANLENGFKDFLMQNYKVLGVALAILGATSFARQSICILSLTLSSKHLCFIDSEPSNIENCSIIGLIALAVLSTRYFTTARLQTP
jgi:hypothetical protein